MARNDYWLEMPKPKYEYTVTAKVYPDIMRDFPPYPELKPTGQTTLEGARQIAIKYLIKCFQNTSPQYRSDYKAHFKAEIYDTQTAHRIETMKLKDIGDHTVIYAIYNNGNYVVDLKTGKLGRTLEQMEDEALGRPKRTKAQKFSHASIREQKFGWINDWTFDGTRWVANPARKAKPARKQGKK